jgi:hypothetical protein
MFVIHVHSPSAFAYIDSNKNILEASLQQVEPNETLIGNTHLNINYISIHFSTIQATLSPS